MLRRHARVALALTAAAGACRGGCRCGGGGGGDRLARAVERGVEEQLGIEVERIRCGTAACQVELTGGGRLDVTLVGEADGQVAWSTDDVIVGAAVAARVRDQLDGLGLDETVTCPVVQPASEPRVVCELGGGGRVWVDVGDHGGLAVEVALTGELVRVRTDDADQPELERLSRELDHDEAEGPDDDDGDGDHGDDDHGDGDHGDGDHGDDDYGDGDHGDGDHGADGDRRDDRPDHRDAPRSGDGAGTAAASPDAGP